MMSSRDNSISRWIGVVAVLVLISRAANTHAAALALTSLSGAISYGYGYTKSGGGGGEGESQTISGSISGAGFYWQPWFISYSASLSGAFGRSDSSTASSSSNSTALGGSLGLNVFPVSRFPFSLTVTRTDSVLENSQPYGTASRSYTSTRLLARQSYIANSGYNSHLTWSHGQFDSEDSKSKSDVYTADTRKSFINSSILASANYSTSENSSSSLRPQNWGMQLSHSYVPGNQFGLSNFLSTSGSKTDAPNSLSQSQTSQASSSFSWRPEYKPYSFSGGARIAYGENSQKTDTADNASSSSVASLSLGVNYRLSRKISVLILGGGSGGYDKNGPIETVTKSADASLGASYSSDQYSVLGFMWGWNVGGGAGGSKTSSNQTGGDPAAEDNTSDSSASVGVNAGHHASGSWSVGRATVLGVSFSQSVSETVNDQGLGGVGAGTSLSFSGTKRGESGSSFLGVNASTSYSESQTKTNDTVTTLSSLSYFWSLNASRNQTINRLSAITANAGLQWSLQQVTDNDNAINRSANLNLNYRHLRAFGIYSLNYNSNAAYSLLFNEGEDRQASMFWDNSFQYTVGLLDMALDIELNKEGNGTSRGSLRFRATRSF